MSSVHAGHSASTSAIPAHIILTETLPGVCVIPVLQMRKGVQRGESTFSRSHDWRVWGWPGLIPGPHVKDVGSKHHR